ncbi:sodium/potassium-transporting ATPase subunit beta-1 [Stomoxys calcitrans]|uniref:Sodium/potassium-transporting ATPase subunit beta-1 n=1 Tax=Stomoxys calcitrans TaxID=35570 RepID=A0A1I8P7X3_STOCA|nr:sodium/potassium-transporting ATPase subunit beta-1 [Stomoxys calcitrans]XP_013099883.1 sodium/potassium-transporting ATPase subunit beta-1 [Stomoxys calcitrans]
MSKTNGAKSVVTEFQFYAPKEKQSFGQFFYNSNDGTYMGRTPKSWGQLLTFYAIFYIVLAGLFAICMRTLLGTLDDREPKWQLERSLIGTNPGMGFRPLSDDTARGSLIQFDITKNEEKQYWINLMDEFMKDYKDTVPSNKTTCSFSERKDVCSVNIEQLGNCSPSHSYGYNNSKPCVFLKLNKIYNWLPEYYDNPAELPEDMPQQLKEHIAKVPANERQQVWVTCDGLNALDKEKFGSVQYYPSQGFPSYYYPFTNQEGYLSPLIAVQFEKLPLDQMIAIECRAWAKNIEYVGSARDRQGSVTFQLYLDTKA